MRPVKITLLMLVLAACSAPAAIEEAPDVDSPPPITANNAFLYYADLETAWEFYRSVLGLETAADYGFAKIMRVAETSYLTLVDAERGMHSADEPKTVAIALITDELEAWYEYMKTIDVEFRNELNVRDGSAHDGFVVLDPEGYYLEFERFNPHPENAAFMPRLAVESVYPRDSSLRAAELGLGFKATVLWMYYRDLPAIQTFYEDALGLDMIVDQGWTKIYPTSRTGYIGLVDETRGMHSFTEDKGVTVSFLTDDIEGWFGHLRSRSEFVFRTEEIGSESGKVSVFVGYDPENYFIEFDQFLDEPGNERLMELLRGAAR